ncbi:hypothetical protein FL857_07300 [Criibacterium bergeronii]|uniref:ATPase n=1 Tax=Criibacterium bergeronii TaxID=1871336 RepID=A0A552V4Q5_9FIRM|nr:hypothetical protein [Criibacterium bergeronii]TRW25419.1 hypothetical protein FL857_07300 [Criibacterium bergeronii]
MLSVEDKIDSFKTLLQDTIRDNNAQELEQLKMQLSEKLLSFEEKLKNQTQDEQRELENRYKNKFDKVVSTTQGQAQNIILDRQNKIRTDFEKSLKEKLKQDYMGEKGERFLQKAIENIKNYDLNNMTLYIGQTCEQRDRKLIEQQLPNANVKVSQEIELGGLIADNKEETLRINGSLDYALQSKQEQINKMIN